MQHGDNGSDARTMVCVRGRSVYSMETDGDDGVRTMAQAWGQWIVQTTCTCTCTIKWYNTTLIQCNTIIAPSGIEL